MSRRDCDTWQGIISTLGAAALIIALLSGSAWLMRITAIGVSGGLLLNATALLLIPAGDER